MIVCHCRAVTDREIRHAVVEGAQTAADVAEACGAGRDCGCCRDGIEELLSATICLRRGPHGAPRRTPAPRLVAVS